MLGLFAEKVLALACAIQQRALEAETLDEMSRAAGAIHKLGRSMRQSIALQARLETDRARAEASPPARPQAPAAVRKAAQAKRAVERCVWNEYEFEDSAADSLLEDVDDRLAELSEAEAFLFADLDSLIAGLCREFGLDPPQPRARLTLAAPEPAAADSS